MSSVIVDKTLLKLDPENFHRLNNIAFSELVHLSDLYPQFRSWYDSKVFPGLLNGQRKLILRYVGKSLGGIAIVKLTPEERKLCCLRVMPELQGSGLGLRLFSDAFAALGTEKPLLSVSDEHLPQFERVFDHFGFEVGCEYQDLYRERHTEFSFNGLLDTAHSRHNELVRQVA